MSESVVGTTYASVAADMAAQHVRNIGSVSPRDFVRADRLNSITTRFTSFSTNLTARIQRAKGQKPESPSFNISFAEFILAKINEVYSKISSVHNAEFLGTGNKAVKRDEEAKFNPRLLSMFLTTLQSADDLFDQKYFTQDQNSILERYVSLEPLLAACAQTCNIDYPSADNLEAAFSSTKYL